jgi:hypothetical protein
MVDWVFDNNKGHSTRGYPHSRNNKKKGENYKRLAQE